jgi:hypothetical protein
MGKVSMVQHLVYQPLGIGLLCYLLRRAATRPLVQAEIRHETVHAYIQSRKDVAHVPRCGGKDRRAGADAGLPAPLARANPPLSDCRAAPCLARPWTEALQAVAGRSLGGWSRLKDGSVFARTVCSSIETTTILRFANGQGALRRPPSYRSVDKWSRNDLAGRASTWFSRS